ncbi:MAG: ABC transporter permease [Desulfurococcales archaeon]|nr:ABC transporter permease [Desulfurococcales archaeon]
MKLLRGSLRIVYKRKLETIILLVLVAGIVIANSSLQVMKENMKNQVYIQMKDTAGHILVAGIFDEEVVNSISRLPGVVEVRLYPVWFGMISLGNESKSIPLVGWSLASRTTVFVLNGRVPVEGEAVYYHVVTTVPGMVKLNYTIGDEVSVRIFTSRGVPETLTLKISGVAKGYAFLGGAPQSLVVPDHVVKNITGGMYTLLSVLGDSDEPSDIDNLSRNVISLLEDKRYKVSWYIVNKKEENPIVVLFESGISLLSSLTAVTIALAAIIPVTAGLASVVRDVRLIGVLKAVGTGSWQLVMYYALPWIIRAFMGFIVGGLVSPWIAKLLIEKVIVRDVDIIKLQFEVVPFKPYYGLVATTGLEILGFILLASLIPGLYATRLNTIDALNFIGLRGRRGLGLRLPSISLTIHIRDVLTRPWKMLALVVSVLVVMTMSISSIIEVQSINNVARIYEHDIPADAYIYATSTLPSPPRPVWETLRELVSRSSINWMIGDELAIINALGLGDRFGLITILEGDPSVAYPLELGRYPSGKGEAVISRSLALYLDVGLGDTIKVKAFTGELNLIVVGISKSREYNGFYAIVDKITYAEATGVEPGYKEAYIVIDVDSISNNISASMYMRELVKQLEATGFIDASGITKNQIISSIKDFSRMIEGIMIAISIIGGFLAVIVITGTAILDVTGRIKEIAVYNAIGVSRSWIITGIGVQLLLSILIATGIGFYSGYLLADIISKTAARAIGYLEPRLPGLNILLDPMLWTPIVISIVSSLAIIWYKLRRLDLVSVLAE